MTAVDLDAAVLEDLDFEPACEIKLHDVIGSQEPATLLVTGQCPSCERKADSPLVCRPCWAEIGRRGCRCSTCKWEGPRDESLWIVRDLRAAS